VLSILGIAVGFTAWDQADRLATFGIAASIWAVVTILIALFIGGFTTGRMAGLATKRATRLHGVVLWSVYMVLIMMAVSMGLATIMGGTFGLLGSAAGGVAQGTVQEMGRGRSPEAIGERMGVSPDTLRAAAESVRRDIERSQEEISGAVSTGAWVTLLLMGFSLGAAVLGSQTGARRTDEPDEPITRRPLDDT